jgi:hypothetical protein
MTSETLAHTLRLLAEQRYQVFGTLPLRDFGSAAEHFAVVPPELLSLFKAHRLDIAELLDNPEYQADTREHHAQRFEKVAHQHNQYLVFGAAERRQVGAVYVTLLAQLRNALLPVHQGSSLDDLLKSALAQHHHGLWQISCSILESQMGDGDREPPCHEYDAALQLSVLGADPKELREPILDLGCGEEGRLVRFLRGLGLKAFGLDRLVQPEPFLARGDWLTAPLGQARWGTIVSHMAFSNHFFHHHLRKGGHPERYARRTMEILASLQPGGSFFYAPGLPFIEDLLPPDRFAVERRPLAGLPAGPGRTALYAAEILRLV